MTKSTAQSTQGPNNPGTAVTGACAYSFGSVLGYSPAGNVLTSNNVRASVTHCGCCDANTNCLKATNFGFTIPPGSIINGIKVEIEKRSDPGSFVVDNELELLKGGVEVGLNYASPVGWPSADAYSTYGSCTDLWGTTWTAADINAANFGVAFASIDYTCGGNVVSAIDNIRITICYTATLPVELTKFTAIETEKEVLVSWETQSEINNAWFILERSMDGISFSPLATITGAGTSNTQHDYAFTDKTPFKGINYYRLLQLDFNGEQEIFGPETVNHQYETELNAIAHWDENNLKLFIDSPQEADLSIVVLTTAGSQILTKWVNAQKGQNTFMMYAIEVPRGFYTLLITDTKTGNIKSVKVFR